MKNKKTKHPVATDCRWQQGDILGLRVCALPIGCKAIPADNRGVVLAESEITGHYHAIEETCGIALMEEPATKRRFLVNSTTKAVTIRHHEHKPVTVTPGIWQIGQVREKDWFADMVRLVRD